MLAVAAVFLGLALPRPAAADEFSLIPAYPATPLRGPAAAKGAVIWNHGVNFIYGKEASTSPIALYLTLFRDAGWDVFRLLRPRMSEEPNASSDEVAATAERLKQQGYARIVLTGQSGGAWLSLMAAGKSDAIHAVIADAPAWYGTNHPYYRMNRYVLLGYIDGIRHGRIMISYFKGDPYDPGGRGPRSAALLAEHGVPHLVLDQPQGFTGHFGGMTALFVRRFGACLLAVAGNGPMPTLESCDSGWGEAPSAALPVPPHLTLATPSGGPADPFLGKWYGYYGNGREVMLAIERAEGQSVEAAYVIGPGLTPALKPGLSQRRGQVEGGALIFAAKGRPSLKFSQRADGALDALWIAANCEATLTAVLHRVN